MKILRKKNYQRILENNLDPGEASAIALALEKSDALLIMDDFKGRKEAKKLGITLTGTLGVLILAKEKGIINSLTEIVTEIKKTDFRLDEKLIQEAKKICGEE